MRRAIQAVLLLGALLPGTEALATTSEPQGSNQKKYEKALEASFISFGGWETDYDVARARAKREGKLLFTFFSRSYAP